MFQNSTNRGGQQQYFAFTPCEKGAISRRMLQRLHVCHTACNGRETARRCCHSLRRCSAMQAAQHGEVCRPQQCCTGFSRVKCSSNQGRYTSIHLRGFALTLLRHKSVTPTPGSLPRNAWCRSRDASGAVWKALCFVFVLEHLSTGFGCLRATQPCQSWSDLSKGRVITTCPPFFASAAVFPGDHMV